MNPLLNQTTLESISRRPLRVVSLGGGTGLSTLLRGLKKYVVEAGVARIAQNAMAIGDLAAIVTVTDDGGSSGRLRKEFNILPPGDIRNCLVALSEDEALLSKLFQYRFSGGENAGKQTATYSAPSMAGVLYCTHSPALITTASPAVTSNWRSCNFT